MPIKPVLELDWTDAMDGNVGFPVIALRLLTCGLALATLPALGGTRTYFVHGDHLGTPQVMTDSDQRVVWTARYQPFGEATVDENPDGDGHAT